MAYDGYRTLRVRREGGVAWVTIDHPPINLFDLILMKDIAKVGRELEADPAIRAVIFESANPEFFIAHADVAAISEMPVRPAHEVSELSGFQRMAERYRRMSKITIGKLEGCARGGGSEFLLSLDMRFAARGRAIVGQPEVALGILPGGTGTQRLPRLMGRARALEAVIGCGDFDADQAERYGWVNRALPAEELAAFVDTLARRIASFPAEAIALAKRAVDASERPLAEALLEENRCFAETLAIADTQRRMRRFLEVGGQTRDGELDLPALYREL